MSLPAIIYLALTLLGLLAAAHLHGRTTTVNFPARAVGTAITMGLLYWGGFFG